MAEDIVCPILWIDATQGTQGSQYLQLDLKQAFVYIVDHIHIADVMTATGDAGLRNGAEDDTSVCMNRTATARDRLIDAATRLFAQHGYRGASVRAICDLARANPGAVSYYFGGKRQLYRIVVRKAAASLTAAVSGAAHGNQGLVDTIRDALIGSMERLAPDDAAFRLLLRDLSEGGDGTAEAVAPLLRQAYEALLENTDPAGGPEVKRQLQASIIRSLAPAFLILGAWPVLARGFGLEPGDRRNLLEVCLRSGQPPLRRP